VGLEVTKEGIGLVQVQRDRGTEFQILGAATLKLSANAAIANVKPIRLLSESKKMTMLLRWPMAD